jgi:hypothetical protein
MGIALPESVRRSWKTTSERRRLTTRQLPIAVGGTRCSIARSADSWDERVVRIGPSRCGVGFGYGHGRGVVRPRDRHQIDPVRRRVHSDRRARNSGLGEERYAPPLTLSSSSPASSSSSSAIEHSVCDAVAEAELEPSIWVPRISRYWFSQALRSPSRCRPVWSARRGPVPHHGGWRHEGLNPGRLFRHAPHA